MTFKKFYYPLSLLSFLSISYALYLTFLVVPNEKIMGPVQRIFYFHVGSAFAAYIAIAVVFFCSLGFFATNSRKFEATLRASGEIAFLFCTVVLASGMIWGYSAWNTVFRMEPRLISFLLLWFIFLSFNILRMFGDEEKVATQLAALGIIGTITVPLMIYSIKLLPQAAQLHPQVVERGGLPDPTMKYAFLMCSLALIIFQAQLLTLRTKISFLELEKNDLTGDNN